MNNACPGLLQQITPSNTIHGKAIQSSLHVRDGHTCRQTIGFSVLLAVLLLILSLMLSFLLLQDLLLLQLFEFWPHQSFNPRF